MAGWRRKRKGRGKYEIACKKGGHGLRQKRVRFVPRRRHASKLNVGDDKVEFVRVEGEKNAFFSVSLSSIFSTNRSKRGETPIHRPYELQGKEKPRKEVIARVITHKRRQSGVRSWNFMSVPTFH